MVSLSVHLVRSTKTRLSLSHHACSTLGDQAANTNFDHNAPAMQHPVHVRLAVRTAQALQQLAHVRLAVRASNHIDTPRLIQRTVKNWDIDLPTSTNISYPQWTSSCTSTTRPTSATRNNRPAAPIYDSTIPATDTNHLVEDTTTMNFTYALVNTTINCHLCYICYLAFVSILSFGCHYSHA